MSKVPPAVAAYSGMRVIGNHIGYLLGALVVAYINAKSWKQSFITGTLTIIVATFVYYFLIAIFHAFGIGYTESIPELAKGVLFWCVIGVVVGVISATAMRIVIYSKSKTLRYDVLITTYVVMFVVLYQYNIQRIITWHNNLQIIENGYLTGYFGEWNFFSDLYEVGFAFVLITILFVIGSIRAKKEMERE